MFSFKINSAVFSVNLREFGAEASEPASQRQQCHKRTHLGILLTFYKKKNNPSILIDIHLPQICITTITPQSFFVTN